MSKPKEPARVDEVPVPELSAAPTTERLDTLPLDPEPLPVATEPVVRRRRRSRAKVEEAPPAPPAGPSPDDLNRCKIAVAATFDVVGKLMARRRGPHWVLAQEECNALGEVWTTALAPYLSRIGAAVPWGAALAVTFAMVQPRLARDAELASPGIPGEPPALKVEP